MSFRILACHGTSFESRGIEFLTGPRSHIRIQALRDCHVDIGHDGKPVLIKKDECAEAWNTGVRIVPSWDTDYEKGTTIEAFSLREPLTEDQFAIGAKFLCRQIGKPYDWPGCLRLALPPGARPTPDYDKLEFWNYDKWFCSELGAALLAIMGLPCFGDVKAYDVTPQMLPGSLRFNETPEMLVIA